MIIVKAKLPKRHYEEIILIKGKDKNNSMLIRANNEIRPRVRNELLNKGF